MPAQLAFGITAAHRDNATVGSAIERLGYGEIWVNDTRRGDGIATVAELAGGSSTLRLAVGVVALSEYGPAAIRDRLTDAAVPLDRLTLGVGAGASASLALVRSGVSDLRMLVPGVPIAVAAVGPRMLRLAGEVADAVVATWALPDRIAWIRDRIAEGGGAPRVTLYLRTAIGSGAGDRLRRETDRYAAYGPHYARAIRAQAGALLGVAVDSCDRHEIAAALDPYRSLVDTLVVRALPEEERVEAWLQVAESVADAWSLG